MTLSAITPLIEYIEDGVTLAHSIPFQFNLASEIRGTRTDPVTLAQTLLISGADYSVTGGGGSTGSITKTSAGISGTILRIERVTPRAQTTDYDTSGVFPATSHEAALDRLAAVDQEQDAANAIEASRALRVPGPETVAALPRAADRGARFMQWSADGLSLTLHTVLELAKLLVADLVVLLGSAFKGDPGSPGEGYATRAALALAGNTATALDDAYLTEGRRKGKFVFYTPALYAIDYPGRVLVDGVAADPQQIMFVAKQGDATGAGGAWVREYSGALRPEWGDAVGDGVANDHEAFRGLGKLGAYFGELEVSLKPGATYLVGKQNPNALDDEGGGPFYRAAEHPIYAANLSSLIVHGNGATLKTNGGMSFGAFNTSTGLPENYTSPAAPFANRAQIGFPIFANNVETVRISDLIVDGNSAAQVIGGTTQTGGVQCQHSAYKVSGCKNVTVINATLSNLLQDGRMIAQPGLTEASDPRPHLEINVKAKNVGRNCLSIVGSNQATFINCSEINPANAPISGGGVLGSDVRSCVDVEAEGAVNRDVRLIGCDLRQGLNGNSTIVSVGDSKRLYLDKCTLVGRSWLNGASNTAVRCNFFGTVPSIYNASANPAERAVFDDCVFNDGTIGDTPLVTIDLYAFGGGGGQNAIVRNSRFILTRKQPNFTTNISTENCKFHVRFGTEYVASGGQAILMGAGSGMQIKPEIFDEIAGTPPVNAYILTPAANILLDGTVVSAGSRIKWIASGASGHTGKYNNYDPVGTRGVTVYADVGAVLYPRQSTETHAWDGPLTAARTVQFYNAGAVAGDRKTVVRRANATGAFDLTILDNGAAALKALSAAGQWAIIEYDGATWRLIASGAL